MNSQQKAQLQQITRRALKNVNGHFASDAPQSSQPSVGSAPDNLRDVPVHVSVGLGKATLMLGDLMAMKKGDILTLDKQAGDPVDVYVNNHLVAHGELTLNGEQFGVVLTSLVS
ncbi:MAG: flagellar motor switch protein FliN [Alphaproteobacteria bacterium]|nr:flagellar motor switch protein FliN [Alphaproteobacteria bacterium]